MDRCACVCQAVQLLFSRFQSNQQGVEILTTSASNFERFRELVLSEAKLQRQLRECGSEEFVTKVVELGAARGFEFSRTDVDKAMNEARRIWLERWLL